MGATGLEAGIVRLVSTGPPIWVTAIDCPRTVRFATRARPVFWVKEKLTTPLATLPMVSQDWSLLRGGNTPLRGRVVGGTGSSETDPAPAGTLTGVRGTNSRVSFRILPGPVRLVV